MARPFLLCSNGSRCGHSEELVSCIQQKAEQSIVVQVREKERSYLWHQHVSETSCDYCSPIGSARVHGGTG